MPTPIFNGKAIEMREGYVRTEDLLLWPENHRIELDVAGFREKNGRAPGRDELIQILQGRMPLLATEKPDPYKIRALADSIAVKGVQVPPVIDWWGIPKDGNRRLAACMLILIDPDFTAEQKDRAARIRVWQTAENPSQDQIDAIVVSLNFEDDHKLPWPEYVKARQVARYWDELKLRFRDVPSAQDMRELRREVAERFAIKTGEVTRYMKMVGWAERFQQHHVESRNRSDAEASFRANELFQYFYELDAGRGDDKLSVKMQEDDDFQALVFDLLYDGKFRNWTQVRHLRKVLSSEPALELVKKAHVTADPEEGRRLIEAGLDEARKDDLAMKRIGMGDWLAEIVKRLDGAPPVLWHDVDTTLLRSLRRVMIGAEAAVRAELIDRGETSGDGVA